MLSVKNISKRLPDGNLLLKNISFEVKENEFIGILGRSGVGKTVLLRCINGLSVPDSGEVVLTINGITKKINGQKGKELREIRQKIGIIFQSFNLVKRLSVIENVMTGKLGTIDTIRSVLYGFTDEEAILAIKTLTKVGIDHLAHRRAETLSGGEMQRVAIAKAIMQNPYIILADEPVANLDPNTAEVVLNYMIPLLEKMSIIGVFHDPDLVKKYCTRAIAIKDGTIIYDGSPNIAKNDLEFIYARGDSNSVEKMKHN